MQRHEEEHARLDAILGTCDAGVAHAVAALIEIKRSLARLPARRPYGSGVIDIEIPSAIVHRHTVVAVAGDSAELRVLVERVSAGGVRDQREEILISKIVDPWPRGLWVRDYIFTESVIKMSEGLHNYSDIR